jgi:hypothetical protein
MRGKMVGGKGRVGVAGERVESHSCEQEHTGNALMIQ